MVPGGLGAVVLVAGRPWWKDSSANCSYPSLDMLDHNGPYQAHPSTLLVFWYFFLANYLANPVKAKATEVIGHNFSHCMSLRKSVKQT